MSPYKMLRNTTGCVSFLNDYGIIQLHTFSKLNTFIPKHAFNTLTLFWLETMQQHSFQVYPLILVFRHSNLYIASLPNFCPLKRHILLSKNIGVKIKRLYTTRILLMAYVKISKH